MESSRKRKVKWIGKVSKYRKKIKARKKRNRKGTTGKRTKKKDGRKRDKEKLSDAQT